MRSVIVLTEAQARVLELFEGHCGMVERRWVAAHDLFPGTNRASVAGRVLLAQLARRAAVKFQRLACGRIRYAPVDEYAAEPTCRVCACTRNHACFDEALGPCCWIAPDLCSHCCTAEPEA